MFLFSVNGQFYITCQYEKKPWKRWGSNQGKKQYDLPLPPSSETTRTKATADGEEDVKYYTAKFLISSLPKVIKLQKKNNNIEVWEEQKELIRILKENVISMQIVADNVFMSKDTTRMDLISWKYYEARKSKVARQMGLK